MLLLSDELMSCCATGINGCLELRCRAFALDGRVSVEWNRCPCSMARRARNSVASVRRSSVGWMPARIGRWCRTQASSHNSQDVVDGGIDEGVYEHCGNRAQYSTVE